ncbi:MAG: hypothetical protein E7474_00220 [Ruminococcaceae bacterium]|nr:hypothetical protein [Oscillospiraceae bacterium]
MLWKDRLMSAVLALAMTAAVSAAVWRLSPEQPRFTPDQLDTGITFEATGVPSGEIIATLGDNGAEAELYTFWLGNECANLKGAYGIDVAENWDMDFGEGKTLKDYVSEDTMTAIKQQLVLENLCETYGVALSDEDEAELAAQRASYVEEFGGEEGYLTELYKLGISDGSFTRLSRTNYLYSALYQAYRTPGSALCPSDDVLRAYAVGKGWITADHLLLMTVDPATYTPLDEETKAAKRAQAEELLAQLRASDDPKALFAQLADEYSEDTGRAFYPEGYTFTHGTMVEAFDAAARALGEGEISDLVETEYGWHIILRKPLNVAEAVESVREEYFDAFFLGELERAELTVSPAAASLDAAALYDALRAAQAEDDAPDASGETAAP